MGVQDKVCIVTGGGSGLGREFCVQLAKEGGKIVVADINKEGADETVQMVTNDGGQAFSVQVDVTNPSQIDNMLQSTLDKYGSIDVVCNNAGIGVFMISKRVIPQMVTQGKRNKWLMNTGIKEFAW